MIGSNKFSNRNKFILGVLILTMIFLTPFTYKLFNSGFTQSKSVNRQSEYSSVDELYKNTTIDLELPSIISERKDLEIRDTMGQLIEVGCSDFVFKAAHFVNVDADVLGLYAKSEIDIKYTSINKDEQINFVRFRSGYEEYPNCTLVNWCTNNTSYGIMLAGIYNQQEALKMLDIDILNYTEYKVEEPVIEITETVEYTIGNQFTVEFPYINSDLSVVDMEGYTMVYLNKILCFVWVYNDLDIQNKTFDTESKIQVNKNLYFYHKTNNPFEIDSIAYNDYNKFMSTVNNIFESIEYQK